MKAFKNTHAMLRRIWKISPSRILWQTLSTCFSFSYGAFYTLILFRFLINALQDGRPFIQVVVFLIIFSVYGLAVDCVKQWLDNHVIPKTDQVILETLTREAYEKAIEVDLKRYEDPAHYDRFKRALTQLHEKTLNTLSTLSRLIAQIFALILNAGFILWIAPDLLLISLLPIILIFAFTQQHASRVALRDQQAVPAQRRMDYFGRVAYLPQYAKELRLSQVGSLLRRQFGEAVDALKDNANRHGRATALWRAAGELTNLVGLYIGLYLFASWRYLAHGAFQLGDFASFSGAILNIVYFVEDISQSFGTLRQNELYAEHLDSFMQEKPTIKTGSLIPRFETSLEFRDVGFAYEGTEHFTLRHVNLRITPGERIALVGANGAGKTTLIKLLLRLYEPTEGEILLDDRPYLHYDLEALRALFATAFQDFQQYACTIAENVLMRPAAPADTARIASALAQSGLNASPEQALTREFSDTGLVLSGGQAQRLNVARVFASDAPFAVLDEPSAALDPLAEADIFARLMAAGQRRTTLFVSHRLSSVRSCTCVYVLADGTLAEHGTHTALMKQDGLYARMYNAQAARYRNMEVNPV